MLPRKKSLRGSIGDFHVKSNGAALLKIHGKPYGRALESRNVFLMAWIVCRFLKNPSWIVCPWIVCRTPGNGSICKNLKRFRKSFRNLLQLYGRHIWHVEFVFRLNVYTGVAEAENSKLKSLYLMIQRCLCLMPNLRTVKIFLDTDQLFRWIERKNPSLSELLVSNPLPKLEHLVALKVVQVPRALLSGLLEANSPVRSFSLETDSDPSDCFPVRFTNIKLDALQEFAGTVIGREDFAALKSASWPALKSLKVRLPNFAEIGRICQTISKKKYGPRLKLLILSPPAATFEYNFNKVIKAKLDLPQLETLKVICPRFGDAGNGIYNVDFFLAGCTSLVKLELVMYVPEEPTSSTSSESEKNKGKSKVIRFKYENTKSLLESNIWTILPKLRRVQIVWKVYMEVSRRNQECAKKCGRWSGIFDDEKYEFTREQYKALQQSKVNSNAKYFF